MHHKRGFTDSIRYLAMMITGHQTTLKISSKRNQQLNPGGPSNRQEPPAAAN